MTILKKAAASFAVAATAAAGITVAGTGAANAAVPAAFLPRWRVPRQVPAGSGEAPFSGDLESVSGDPRSAREQ